MPDDRDPETGQFIKGKIGGPGRPKGSRNKLGEDFIQALADDFAEHGVEAIATCRQESAKDYVKVVASLLPKEMILRKPEQDLSDGELAEMLDALRSLAVSAGIDPRGDQPTHRGSGTA